MNRTIAVSTASRSRDITPSPTSVFATVLIP